MKSVLRKIGLFLKGLIGDLFELFRNHAETAVAVTGRLKLIVESPIADFVTDLIPSDVDNRILSRLRIIVPKVAQQVAITYGILDANDKNSDAVKAIVSHLREVNPSARASFWITFAGELNIALSDGKLTLAEAVSLSQLVYAERKKATS